MKKGTKRKWLSEEDIPGGVSQLRPIGGTCNVTYFASRDGHIYSKDRQGRWLRLHETKVYTKENRKGTVYRYKKKYLLVNIYVSTNVQKKFLLHRLVASVFCPRPSLFCVEVDHIDGNPANNHADNLEWVTTEENTRRRTEMYWRKKQNNHQQ